MTGNSNYNNIPTSWVDGELRLVGLDSRMIGLLRAIDQSGSINQAAKQVGLSYKGAWQIIERANNSAPKTLVSTATGGNKGGGTCLTESGRSLLLLYTSLEQQHRQFLEQLNHNIADNSDTVLLLQRLVVKTSARNQIFGSIIAIQTGAVNAEIVVELKGGEHIVSTLGLSSISDLGLKIGTDAVVLINSSDIMLSTDFTPDQYSARNCLPSRVIRIQQDEVNVEVIVLLSGGETLVTLLTQQDAQSLSLVLGMSVWAIFKSNSPILGS